MLRKYKKAKLKVSLTLSIIKVFGDNFSRLLPLLTVLQRQRQKAEKRRVIIDEMFFVNHYTVFHMRYVV